MDQRTTLHSPPETPREFGFWLDGAWEGGRPLFERASPGHGVAVTRTQKCTVADLDAFGFELVGHPNLSVSWIFQ